MTNPEWYVLTLSYASAEGTKIADRHAKKAIFVTRLVIKSWLPRLPMNKMPSLTELGRPYGSQATANEKSSHNPFDLLLFYLISIALRMRHTHVK